MNRRAKRFFVVGPCPKQGLVPTHAFLTVRQFASLHGPLHYWCTVCRSAHCAEAESLRLAQPDGHEQAPVK